MIYYIVGAIAVIACPVLSYSAGAPKAACADLTPQHGKTTSQTGAPSYTLHVDEKHQPFNIILKGNSNDDIIKGFMIQARLDNKPVGKFIPDTFSQTLTCDADSDTLTHQKITQKISQINAKWMPDAALKGKNVQFVATVVQNGGTFWARKLNKNVKIQ